MEAGGFAARARRAYTKGYSNLMLAFGCDLAMAYCRVLLGMGKEVAFALHNSAVDAMTPQQYERQLEARQRYEYLVPLLQATWDKQRAERAVPAKEEHPTAA